ncbi:MAG: class III poly(R)-hydroxyalkanoic acid synthase subunit PhaE [Pseudomonadota bacterium]|nr:class III poly(R)-hydroxyalkanoic acid synthase subunit PhaE [Pseudomonadota bacterium]
MTENSANQDWWRLQQQFWETWLSLNRHTVDRSTSQLKNFSKSSSWAETLELWWQILAPVIPAEQINIFKKFVDQSQHYIYLNELFIKTFQPLFAQPFDNKAWQSTWKEGFEQLKQSFIEQLQDEKNPLNWALSVDNWQQSVPLFSLLTVFQNLGSEGLNAVPADMQTYRQRFFAGTPIHSLQKWQQRYQHHWQLGMAYQQAHKEYICLLSTVGEQAIELLKHKLEERFQTGQSIEHLYQFYELWIAASEQAYAQVVNSKEYSEIYAQLINKLMAFKHHERQLIEAFMASFNLPTRKELDAMNARIQQLRREMRALPLDDQEACVTELKQTIEQLKLEIETLKKAQTPKKRKSSTRNKSSK